MPSAPAAIDARDMGTTLSRRPVPCDGSTTIGRCDRRSTAGTTERSSVLRVKSENVRMPRSHRTTFGLPSERMYSAASRNSSSVADIPRFRSTGFPGATRLLQELEVLHVARAHLKAVGVRGHEVDRLGVEHLGDDGQARRLTGLRENLQALLGETLESIRRRPRLVGAAAQNVGSSRLDLASDRERLLPGLDGAGSRDDDDARAADGDAAHGDDGVLGVELAGDELVRMRDPDDLENARQALERARPHRALVARDADRRALRARNRVGFQPEPLRGGDDAFDVFARGAPVHDDQHASALSPATFILHPAASSPGRLPEVPMSPSARTFLLPAAALVVAALSALPAEATYVIYTKDGHRIEAREKPVVSGRRVIYLTPLGTSQTIAIDEWDQERSEKANREGLGGAYVLDDPGGRTSSLPAPDAKKPSLSDYIKKHGRNPDADRPEPRAGALSEREPRAPRAPAGKAAEAPPVVLDPVVSDAFMRALDGSNVKGVKLGNLPSALRVQAVTDNEQQVFLALMASARGLKEARAAGKPLEKVEVVLATANGESAARFDVSPDDADALLNGRISPSKYFVTRVIF